MSLVDPASDRFSAPVPAITNAISYYIGLRYNDIRLYHRFCRVSQIAGFMWPTWGPPGSCQPQMGSMLAPWILLSGMCNTFTHIYQSWISATMANKMWPYMHFGDDSPCNHESAVYKFDKFPQCQSPIIESYSQDFIICSAWHPVWMILSKPQGRVSNFIEEWFVLGSFADLLFWHIHEIGPDAPNENFSLGDRSSEASSYNSLYTIWRCCNN